jgi:hypothetical protein
VPTVSLPLPRTATLGLAVGTLRRDGRDVDDELLAHIWPSHHENVHFYGTHSVDIDGLVHNLAKTTVLAATKA